MSKHFDLPPEIWLGTVELLWSNISKSGFTKRSKRVQNVSQESLREEDGKDAKDAKVKKRATIEDVKNLSCASNLLRQICLPFVLKRVDTDQFTAPELIRFLIRHPAFAQHVRIFNIQHKTYSPFGAKDWHWTEKEWSHILSIVDGINISEECLSSIREGHNVSSLIIVFFQLLSRLENLGILPRRSYHPRVINRTFVHPSYMDEYLTSLVSQNNIIHSKIRWPPGLQNLSSFQCNYQVIGKGRDSPTRFFPFLLLPGIRRLSVNNMGYSSVKLFSLKGVLNNLKHLKLHNLSTSTEVIVDIISSCAALVEISLNITLRVQLSEVYDALCAHKASLKRLKITRNSTVSFQSFLHNLSHFSKLEYFSTDCSCFLGPSPGDSLLDTLPPNLKKFRLNPRAKWSNDPDHDPERWDYLKEELISVKGKRFAHLESVIIDFQEYWKH